MYCNPYTADVEHVPEREPADAPEASEQTASAIVRARADLTEALGSARRPRGSTMSSCSDFRALVGPLRAI